MDLDQFLLVLLFQPRNKVQKKKDDFITGKVSYTAPYTATGLLLTNTWHVMQFRMNLFFTLESIMCSY